MRAYRWKLKVAGAVVGEGRGGHGGGHGGGRATQVRTAPSGPHSGTAPPSPWCLRPARPRSNIHHAFREETDRRVCCCGGVTRFGVAAFDPHLQRAGRGPPCGTPCIAHRSFFDPARYLWPAARPRHRQGTAAASAAPARRRTPWRRGGRGPELSPAGETLRGKETARPLRRRDLKYTKCYAAGTRPRGGTWPGTRGGSLSSAAAGLLRAARAGRSEQMPRNPLEACRASARGLPERGPSASASHLNFPPQSAKAPSGGQTPSRTDCIRVGHGSPSPMPCEK